MKGMPYWTGWLLIPPEGRNAQDNKQAGTIGPAGLPKIPRRPTGPFPQPVQTVKLVRRIHAGGEG